MRRAADRLKPAFGAHDTPCTREVDAQHAAQGRLLHPVSFGTVLKPDKREAHARAAAWLQHRVGNRCDEHRGMTVKHCARTDVHSLAAEWFVRVATKANDRSAVQSTLQALGCADEQATRQTRTLSPERKAKKNRRGAGAPRWLKASMTRAPLPSAAATRPGWPSNGAGLTLHVNQWRRLQGFERPGPGLQMRQLAGQGEVANRSHQRRGGHLAGGRVLHRAADPVAAGHRVLASAELAQGLSGFTGPELRERMRNTVPWHRDVIVALALGGDAAG